MLANSFIKALAIKDFKSHQFLLGLNHWHMSNGTGVIDTGNKNMLMLK